MLIRLDLLDHSCIAYLSGGVNGLLRVDDAEAVAALDGTVRGMVITTSGTAFLRAPGASRRGPVLVGTWAGRSSAFGDCLEVAVSDRHTTNLLALGAHLGLALHPHWAGDPFVAADHAWAARVDAPAEAARAGALRSGAVVVAEEYARQCPEAPRAARIAECQWNASAAHDDLCDLWGDYSLGD